MRNLFVLTFLTLALLSCQSEDPFSAGASSAIVGRWEYSHMASTVDIQDDWLRTDTERWINDQEEFRGVSLTYLPNGTFREEYRGRVTGSGPYSVSGNNLIMFFEGEIESTPDTTQFAIDGNTFTMIIDFTERYKKNYPKAGVNAVIERRCFISSN